MKLDLEGASRELEELLGEPLGYFEIGEVGLRAVFNR